MDCQDCKKNKAKPDGGRGETNEPINRDLVAGSSRTYPVYTQEVDLFVVSQPDKRITERHNNRQG